MAQLESLISTISLNAGSFIQTMGQVDRRLGQWARKMEQLGDFLTEKVTAPLLALAGGSTKLAMDYEASFAAMGAKTNLTAEELAKLKDQVLDLAGPMGKGPDELNKGLDSIASAGYNGAKSLEILTTAAKSSAASFGETKAIADGLTGALFAYGAENISVSRTADIFAATIRAGKAEANELVPALSGVLGTAGSLDLKLEEVGAAMATMTLSNKSASEASTGLQNTLKALFNPTDKAQEALRLIGKSADDLRSSLREKGLLATLMDLKAAFGGNTVALKEIFTDFDGLKAVMDLAGKNSSEYARILREIENSAGTVDEGFKKVSDTTQHRWNVALAESQVLLIKIGRDVLPHVNGVLEKMTALLREVTEWWGGLTQESKEAILQWGALAAALGPVVLALAGLVRVVRTLVGWGTAFVKFAAVAGPALALVIGAASMTGPVGLLGIGAALTLVALDFESIMPRISGSFDQLSRAAENFLTSWREKLDGVATSSSAAFQTMAKDLGNFKEQMGTAGTQLKGTIDGAFGAVLLGGQATVTAAEQGGGALRKWIDVAEEFGKSATPKLREHTAAVKEKADAEKDAAEKTASSFGLMMETRWALDDIDEQKNEERLERDKARMEDYREMMTDRMQQYGHAMAALADSIGSSFAATWEELKKSGEVLTSLAEGIKSFAIRVLDMVATQLIAHEAASVAASLAQAPFTFGASLAAIPKILAAVGPALLGIEGAKGIISGLAHGGDVVRAGVFKVGERGQENLFLPAGAAVRNGAGEGMTTIIVNVGDQQVAKQVLRKMPGILNLYT